MRLLFITRTYPPLVGGMERFASDFYHNYSKVGEIDLIANSIGKKALLPFLFRTVAALVRNGRRYDVVHIYDAVLFSLIPIIRLFSRARISFTVNGLDVVYPRFGYQRIMPFFLKRADKVIAISRYTMLQCNLRGIPAEKLSVIPIGITFDELGACSDAQQSSIFIRFNLPRGRKVLFTIGRLVKRKGHAWFVENVVRRLPDDHIYVIAGDGPELGALKGMVADLGLDGRVFLLGQVSEEEKCCLYQISDLVIMPNITQDGDQEGFGIVLLEAGRYGLPVVASDIEGIKDVVIEGETGHLIRERDVQGFVDAILNPVVDRASLPGKVAASFDWQHVIERYQREFATMVGS